MTNKLKVTVVAAIFLTFAVTTVSYAAGHFALAFQRQIPAWENGGGTGCLGNHFCRVWVFDESGNIMPNIELRTTSNVPLGHTDADGRCEIVISIGNDIDVVCLNGQGTTSDIAYLMTSNRPECWGHYSFEVCFLYKTDISNPGEFDLDMNGTWNEPTPAPQDDDSPYTKSLAYNGVDSTDYWADQSDLGNWQNPPSYFGQTFVATGNRVVAARVHGTIGGTAPLDWQVRIVTFPGLDPVGPPASVPVRAPHGWEAFWGVNDCPVVPGQTYMLQVWRGGGMNIYLVTDNVYPQGQYYEGTTAFPGLDLNGHVCCMSYADLPLADFNGDGKVDLSDFCKLVRYWLQNEPQVDVAPAPIGDNIVNFKDLSVLVENWLIATTIPPLPGQASIPIPANDTTDVSTTVDLSWTVGSDATSHDVYFGTSSPGTFQRNQTETIFDPNTLAPNTPYYWRIDEVNVWGKTIGQVWSFTTTGPPPP